LYLADDFSELVQCGAQRYDGDESDYAPSGQNCAPVVSVNHERTARVNGVAYGVKHRNVRYPSWQEIDWKQRGTQEQQWEGYDPAYRKNRL